MKTKAEQLHMKAMIISKNLLPNGKEVWVVAPAGEQSQIAAEVEEYLKTFDEMAGKSETIRQAKEVLARDASTKERCCGNCQWWALLEWRKNLGLCRRYPPTVTEIQIGSFPMTTSELSCGEFTPTNQESK